MAVRRQNRYLLVAHKKGCNHTNDLLKDENLDLSKVIIIDVPYLEDEKKNLDLPRRKVKDLDSKKLEKQSKRPLSLIDLFVFEHSHGGMEQFKNYLKKELHYQIPDNFEFSIVYRSKDAKEEACFKTLEPIYGNRTSIVIWLSDLAKTEYENRGQDKTIGNEQMRSSAAWKSVWTQFVEPDVTSKGSIVNSFATWVDTRGSVGQMKKKYQKEEFDKMIEEIEEDRRYAEIKLASIQKYPLGVIMEICQRHPKNIYAWGALKTKLCSYKEIRGFLLCRYHYKKSELNYEFERMLKNTKIASSNIVYDIELLEVPELISIYDLLRYSDCTLSYLESEELLNETIKNYDVEVKNEVENAIKKKKSKDVVSSYTKPKKEHIKVLDEPTYTQYHFYQGGNLKTRRVEIEHEEELMYPEDFLPEYQDPDMINQTEELRRTLKRK